MAVTSEQTAASISRALREALERRDINAVRDLYADDAVAVTYSERNRPSSAEELRGRHAIEEMWREVERRNLTEEVLEEVVGENRFALTLQCTYPSGEKVIGTYICEVRDGKVVRQKGAEAWDE